MSLFSALSLSTSTLTDRPGKAEGETKVSKVFRPGTYEVKVSEVREPKPDSQDATWMNYMLMLESPTGQRITHFVRVPTKTFAHARDGNGRTEEYRLRIFLRSLGKAATNETILSDLESLFGNNAKGLLNKPLSIEVGYRKMHPQTRAKGEVVIADGKGAIQLDEEGEELVFPDYASANAYGEQKWDKRYSSFPEVTKFVPAAKSETIAPVKKKTGFGS